MQFGVVHSYARVENFERLFHKNEDRQKNATCCICKWKNCTFFLAKNEEEPPKLTQAIFDCLHLIRTPVVSYNVQCVG